MKTFNEYIAETTAPIIMDVVRMQKYEKRIRSARIEKRKRTMRSDKSISIVKNTLKKRGYYRRPRVFLRVLSTAMSKSISRWRDRRTL